MLRALLLSLAFAPLLASAQAAGAATPKPAAMPAKFHRLTLPGSPQLPFPYTLEVPEGWTSRQVLNDPGLWIGPPDAKPNQDPHFIYVRISTVSLAAPGDVVAAIRQNDAKDDSWKALKVEAREVHGVKGVLVEIERAKVKEVEARTSLTLKMPLPKTSVDFVGQAGNADYAKLRPLYERILLSVEPAPKAAAPEAAKKPGR
ncbi:MAG TPA: hypothetical protein VN783_04080 [Thermoanaerobaculia bacterium]|nr:hypothetical protein [Thermoanaerobaculia bacterium]